MNSRTPSSGTKKTFVTMIIIKPYVAEVVKATFINQFPRAVTLFPFSGGKEREREFSLSLLKAAVELIG